MKLPWPSRRGLFYAALLFAVYVGVWRPARVALLHHAVVPLLEATDTARAERYTLVVPQGQAYLLAQAEGQREALYTAPIGFLFLFPALALLAWFPDKPYWLYLLSYHAVQGLIGVLVFYVGFGWWSGALALYTFSRTYLLEVMSLALPIALGLFAQTQPSDDPARV